MSSSERPAAKKRRVWPAMPTRAVVGCLLLLLLTSPARATLVGDRYRRGLDLRTNPLLMQFGHVTNSITPPALPAQLVQPPPQGHTVVGNSMWQRYQNYKVMPLDGIDARRFSVGDKYQLLKCPTQMLGLEDIIVWSLPRVVAQYDMTVYFMLPGRRMDMFGKPLVVDGSVPDGHLMRSKLINNWYPLETGSWCTRSLSCSERDASMVMPFNNAALFEDGHLNWLMSELHLAEPSELQFLIDSNFRRRYSKREFFDDAY